MDPHTPEGSSAGEEIGRCTMIVLVSNSLRHEEISGRNGQGPDKLYQRVWRSVLDWLLEPIPFPGQWPQNERQAERYNRVEEIVHYDERTPRSGRIVGSSAR